MTQPLDAEAVRRDDELLDALAFGELEPGYEDDIAAQLLLGWREDIVHSPVVVPALIPAPSRIRRGRAISRRMSVAAAVGVIAAGSICSVAAASVAEPGSPLWPITKVVYSDRAESLEARDTALSQIKKAKQAAAKRKPAEARKLLEAALRQVTLVDDGADRDNLEQEVASLRQEIAAIGGPVADPQPSADPSPASPSPAVSQAPAPAPASPAPTDPATPPSPEATAPATDPSPVPTAPDPQPTSDPAGNPGQNLTSASVPE